MSEFVDIDRRRFVQLGLLAATGLFVARPALAAMPRVKGVKHLAFHNLHTDERLSVVYWKDGVYSRQGLAKINAVLRDHRTGVIYPLRPSLFDLLHDMQERVGNTNAIEVISGYRSPQSNATLVRDSGGVARRSYHMKGMAIDLRLPGTPLTRLHKTALAMHRGGVGYYPSSDFVHVDVGPVRKW